MQHGGLAQPGLAYNEHRSSLALLGAVKSATYSSNNLLTLD
jgi:hypothetical protein